MISNITHHNALYIEIDYEFTVYHAANGMTPRQTNKSAATTLRAHRLQMPNGVPRHSKTHRTALKVNLDSAAQPQHIESHRVPPPRQHTQLQFQYNQEGESGSHCHHTQQISTDHTDNHRMATYKKQTHSS